jgi:hypothetical protein
MSRFLHRDAGFPDLDPGTVSGLAYKSLSREMQIRYSTQFARATFAGVRDRRGEWAVRLEIPWPALPWTCPRCERSYRTHEFTMATLEQDDRPDLATFLCVSCDLLVFVGGRSR